MGVRPSNSLYDGSIGHLPYIVKENVHPDAKIVAHNASNSEAVGAELRREKKLRCTAVAARVETCARACAFRAKRRIADQ